MNNQALNRQQLDELIEQYVELVVDSMDMKTLVLYAQEQLTDYFTKLSQHELKEEIDNYSDETYYELVDNILHPTIVSSEDDTNSYKSIPSRY
tara:strand:+ start:75 stop:353 length:279 start_codon:yes stop_codon:yes gene_type:complete